MSIVCHVCGGQMECVEYCMTCNPDGLDITEETELKEKVVEAAVAWGKDGVPKGQDERDTALADAVSTLQRHHAAALQAHREVRNGEVVDAPGVSGNLDGER